jgi:hypothetical protein
VFLQISPIESNSFIHWFQIIGELITIPLLVSLVFILIYSFIQIFKEKKVRGYGLIFMLNLITALVLVAATVTF